MKNNNNIFFYYIFLTLLLTIGCFLALLIPANKKAADERAAALADVVQAKIDAGLSLRQLTAALNDDGIAWQKQQPCAALTH